MINATASHSELERQGCHENFKTSSWHHNFIKVSIKLTSALWYPQNQLRERDALSVDLVITNLSVIQKSHILSGETIELNFEITFKNCFVRNFMANSEDQTSRGIFFLCCSIG